MNESPTVPTAPSRARLYALEAWTDLLKTMRLTAFVVPTLTFPSIFYLLFGVLFRQGGVAQAGAFSTYLVATYGAFGVMGASLFGFGAAVAVERGQGWLEVKRASPMPMGAYFTAKLVTSTAFGALVVGLLTLLAVALGGVRLPFVQWAMLWPTLLAGTLPFGALGLVIGLTAGPNSAPPIVNLVYLPMGFFSGLWIPIRMLPKGVQAFAEALPGFHLGELALAAVGMRPGESPVRHVVYLAAFTVLCLVVATWAWRRSEGKMFG